MVKIKDNIIRFIKEDEYQTRIIYMMIASWFIDNMLYVIASDAAAITLEFVESVNFAMYLICFVLINIIMFRIDRMKRINEKKLLAFVSILYCILVFVNR